MEVYELYDKKFLIYENCMIGRFGQPGVAQIETEVKSETKEKKALVLSKLFILASILYLLSRFRT